MGFECFVGLRTTLKGSRAAIWGQGIIVFNRAAIEKRKLADDKFAALYYDREKKRIGVKFTNDPKEAGARTFRRRKHDGTIYAKAFFGHYGIDYSKAVRFDIDFDEKNGLYVLTEEKWGPRSAFWTIYASKKSRSSPSTFSMVSWTQRIKINAKNHRG
jgi:hypothetical protein